MKWLQRVVAGAEYRSTLAEPPDWMWDAFGGTKSFSGESVTAKTAMEVGAFFACLRLIAMSVGMTPLLVYQGEGRDRKRARESAQWRMLHDAPNEETAADVFWQTAMGDLIVGDGRHADAFFEKAKLARGPRSGRVEELWRLEPGKVDVEREKSGARRKVFKVEGDARTFDAGTILHIPGFASGGLRGTSIVWLARQDIGTAVGRERYEGSYYANGATFPGFLSTDGVLSQPAADRIAASWAAAHGGHKHKTPVLEAGLKWQSVSSPMREQQFAEMSRQTASKVARWFGIDPEMIGGDRSSDTYATVEGRALHFLTFALDSWLVRIEKGLARDPDLFGRVDLFPEFLRAALLRVDIKTRFETYEIGRNIGLYAPNDIAAKENEPQRPDGDVYLDTPAGTAPADPGLNGKGSLAPDDLDALLTEH